MTERGEAARMELDADALHEDEEGIYIDCPEGGSAASLRNVVDHGRCNGYLDQRREETELDEEAMDCMAKLSLELVYDSETS